MLSMENSGKSTEQMTTGEDPRLLYLPSPCHRPVLLFLLRSRALSLDGRFGSELLAFEVDISISQVLRLAHGYEDLKSTPDKTKMLAEAVIVVQFDADVGFAKR